MFLIIFSIGIFLSFFEILIKPYRKIKYIKLFLRSFQNLENDKKNWYIHKTNNIFAQELCDQYLVVTVELDLGVMIYTKHITVLKQQEEQHAIIHNKIMKKSSSRN